VDDSATALFMVRFYENLMGSRQGLHELSRAELEPLAARLVGGALPGDQRPFAHPFYWAAFVLIGDPD
jgi:CHAT domain-containing protein